MQSHRIFQKTLSFLCELKWLRFGISELNSNRQDYCIVFVLFFFNTQKSHSLVNTICVTQLVHLVYVKIESRLSHCYSENIWEQVLSKFLSSLSPLLIHFTLFQNLPQILILSMPISAFERWNNLILSIYPWTVRGVFGWLVNDYKFHPYRHTMCNMIWSACYQWVNIFFYLEVYFVNLNSLKWILCCF